MDKAWASSVSHMLTMFKRSGIEFEALYLMIGGEQRSLSTATLSVNSVAKELRLSEHPRCLCVSLPTTGTLRSIKGNMKTPM